MIGWDYVFGDSETVSLQGLTAGSYYIEVWGRNLYTDEYTTNLDYSLEINAPTYGYSPTQIQNAYGLSPSLGDGTGQTIAIISVGDDPTIANDLCVFDTIINIPNDSSFSFEKVNASGQAYNYPVAADSAGETAIDVEWSHATAPGAKILLVEANPTHGPMDFYEAAQVGRKPDIQRAAVEHRWSR